MATNFEALSPEDVCIFLQEEISTISKDVLEKIVENKIDREVFLTLTDTYLREIAPLLCDRLKIMLLVTKLWDKDKTTTICFPELPFSVC